MEKIINKIINEFTKGVDTYSHNGSTWLIFTDTKQWVIELTESKTLWYNYNFFKGMFAYASMDVVENQHYITKWVEDNIINGVKEISSNVMIFQSLKVDDTIQNGIIEKGVTENSFTYVGKQIGCENVIENGVKETELHGGIRPSAVEDTLQNGIKETGINLYQEKDVRDVIQNGVKETMFNQGHKPLTVKNIIENGIKETRLEMNITEGEVDDIIQDGVKETIECDWNIPKYVINEVVNDGVKSTNMVHMKTCWSVNDTIENGVKNTELHKGIRPLSVEDTIQNGVKETKQKKNAYLVLDTSGRELILEPHLVIRDGVKETKYNQSHQEPKFKEVLKNGVRITLESDWDVPTDVIDGVLKYGTKNPTD
jgi:hypothetical protein